MVGRDVADAKCAFVGRAKNHVAKLQGLVVEPWGKRLRNGQMSKVAFP